MRRVKTIGKFFGRLVWRAPGFVLAAIGLGGLSDDLATWSHWIDTFMNDPLVLQLAGYAVFVAEIINNSWVRVALVISGVLMILWPLRWFWRLRHRLRFRWRRALADKVWISEETAKRVMKESAWGQLKAPTFTRYIGSGIFQGLQGALGSKEIVSGLSETKKTELRFNTYIALALKSFCESNPNSARENEGQREIDEVALTQFLDKAMESDLIKDFGEFPKFKVS